ncbi:transposase [Alloalcanivorax xenomutans]|nr:transposase [Alloalcanivorax xenomutans]KYZ87058.1 transposase [Alcanivorax sp. KX64203]
MQFRSKRRFSDAFKREAVEVSLSSPQTQKQIAAKLGLHPTLLSRWRQEWIVGKSSSKKPVRNAGPTKSLEELERENARLKKQLKRAEMERDILKKADEYFAKLQK